MDGGPVLRVGDRMTCFDPEMDLWLADTASRLVKLNPRFAFQRALMTGGACEASLFQLHGRRVGALAMPLGNYHNMTARGGIGAEFVSIGDFDQALLWLEAMAKHPPQPRVVKTRRAELDAIFERLGSRLLEA
jgi:endoglucanase